MIQIGLPDGVAERLDSQTGGGREERIIWLGIGEQDSVPSRLDRYEEDSSCLYRQGRRAESDVVVEGVHGADRHRPVPLGIDQLPQVATLLNRCKSKVLDELDQLLVLLEYGHVDAGIVFNVRLPEDSLEEQLAVLLTAVVIRDLECADLQQRTGQAVRPFRLRLEDRDGRVFLVPVDDQRIPLAPSCLLEPVLKAGIVLFQGVEHRISEIELVCLDPANRWRRSRQIRVQGVQKGDRVGGGQDPVGNPQLARTAVKASVLADQVLGRISNNRSQQLLIHAVVRRWGDLPEDDALTVGDRGRRLQHFVTIKERQPCRSPSLVFDAGEVMQRRRVRSHIVVMPCRKTEKLDDPVRALLQFDPQWIASDGDIGVDEKQHGASMPRASAYQAAVGQSTPVPMMA